MSALTLARRRTAAGAPLAHDSGYPEEVLRSAWNPEIERAGRAIRELDRAPAARTPNGAPTAWFEGLFEEPASR